MRLVDVRLTVLVLAVSAGAAACASPPPERPRRHRPVKTAVAAPVEVAPQFIEDCAANFRGEPGADRSDRYRAGPAIERGQAALALVAEADDMQVAANLLVESLEQFRTALRLDPYSAEATLELALAYDRVYRKGCALVLLKRLSVLQQHPALSGDAHRAMERVADDPHMFKWYRTDAMYAIGQ